MITNEPRDVGKEITCKLTKIKTIEIKENDKS